MIRTPIFCKDPDEILVFRSLEQAELYYEPWIFEEGFEAFDADGCRLRAESHERSCQLVLKEILENKPDDSERLCTLLLNAFDYVKNRPKNWKELSLEEMVKWCVENVAEKY